MILDQIISTYRQYYRWTGLMPKKILISEAIDQQLCDEMEQCNQWTPFVKGKRPRTMHGGEICGIRVVVREAIPFTMSPDP